MLYERIKEMSERKGLTIYQLAMITGIPKQSLYRLKRNPEYSIELKSAIKIADALNITLNDLAGRKRPQ